MEYIAVYFQQIDSNGVKNFRFLDKKLFSAENDEQAIEKANGIKAAMELLEAFNPRRHKISKKIILTGIRNQSNKQFIRLEGLS